MGFVLTLFIRLKVKYSFILSSFPDYFKFIAVQNLSINFKFNTECHCQRVLSLWWCSDLGFSFSDQSGKDVEDEEYEYREEDDFHHQEEEEERVEQEEVEEQEA